MDMESTLETVASFLPENVQLYGILTETSAKLPSDVDLSDILNHVSSGIPTDLGFVDMAKFLLFFVAGSLILSVLGRVVLGKRSSLNHSVSSAMAILFIYAITIVVYTIKPWQLETFLSPLPFVTLFNDYMVILPVVGNNPTVLCRELLSLIILAFLVNLLDTFIPKGGNVISWYLLRFLTVILAMGAHLVTHYVLDTYLPDVLVVYAPTILLFLMIFLILIGFLNAMLGLILTVTNPIAGALYTFFFSNIVGKQFTKAVFTAAIICAVVFLLGYFDYSFINISLSSLTAYIPFALISLILWYLTGNLL